MSKDDRRKPFLGFPPDLAPDDPEKDEDAGVPHIRIEDFLGAPVVGAGPPQPFRIQLRPRATKVATPAQSSAEPHARELVPMTVPVEPERVSPAPEARARVANVADEEEAETAPTKGSEGGALLADWPFGPGFQSRFLRPKRPARRAPPHPSLPVPVAAQEPPVPPVEEPAPAVDVAPAGQAATEPPDTAPYDAVPPVAGEVEPDAASPAVPNVPDSTYGLPPIVTPDELADFFRTDRKTIYKGLRNGEIPSLRVGGRYIILRDAVLAALWGKKAP